MKNPMSLTLSLLVAVVACATAETFDLQNIHKSEFRDECLRIPVTVPADACRVTVEGKEIPAVVDTVEGKRVLWVRTTIAPAATQKLQIAPGKPKTFSSGVKVKTSGDAITLDNGIFAVKVPAKQGEGCPAPVTSVRMKSKWVGAGGWRTKLPLKTFSATVIDSGSVFGKVRLRYEFDGMAGINGDVPAYAEVDVTLMPGRPFAVIEERHEMGRTDEWFFDATAGWKATGGTYNSHSGGGFSRHIARQRERGQTARAADPLHRSQPDDQPVPALESALQGWLDGRGHRAAMARSGPWWCWPATGTGRTTTPSGA